MEKKMENKEIKKVEVSQLFVDIYKNFNVVTQIDNMKKLTKKELYLLLLVCLDKHSDDDIVVNHNFFEFEKECLQLFELQDQKEVDDTEILALVEETGDKYIDTDNIIGPYGELLIKPLTKVEVRDVKIDIINEMLKNR